MRIPSLAGLLAATEETPNPLIPAPYDIAFSLVPIALAAFAIVSLVSIIRRYSTMSTGESVGWTAFVVLVPALGAIVWFAMGRQRYGLLARRE